MSLSELPLGYCTNVHPGRDVAEVERGLDAYTLPVAREFGQQVAAGLWLARPVVSELLESPGELDRFAGAMRDRFLQVYTLNAFPFGDFHSDVVKGRVYVPDWSDATRTEYTIDCARVLATLLPEGVDGSISTVPLGFKEFEHADDFEPRAIEQLVETARGLARLRDESGQIVRLAIEPEPFCLLETTAEALAFFERLRSRAEDLGAGDEVGEFLGLCYDVCHQSVEFEDVAESIRSIDAAGIRINKVHVTCAIRLENPADADARATLAQYVEPRYLHQTMARTAGGEILRHVDLSADLTGDPPPEFLEADEWRVHYHVPVDAERLGPLATTRGDLRRALETVRDLAYAPHLEVETYTWDVLPGAAPGSLVEGLTRELTATRELLDDVRRG